MVGILPTELRGDLVDVVSQPRFATYLRHADDDPALACKLYFWNMQVSSELYVPLQFAEVAVRNAAIEAISAEFGEDWHRNRGFHFSVRRQVGLARPRRDLQRLAERFPTAGAVAAELKFAFWQYLFVAAQDDRLWTTHLAAIFPGAPAERPLDELRSTVHDDIETIRRLRNRIAHHEPILERPLQDILDQALRLVEWRRPAFGEWLRQNSAIGDTLNKRPGMD